MAVAVWLGISMVAVSTDAAEPTSPTRPETTRTNAAPTEAALPEGTLADVTLADGRTPPASLAPQDRTPVIVLAFLGTECPLAKLYAVDLGEMSKMYADRGVAFYGVDSNAQDSLEKITAFVRRQELPFPVYKDAGNVLADRLGAQRTPEVFVLDAARTVRYRGRIDDRLDIGVVRQSARSKDLVHALDALLAGRPIETPVTEAVGCQIGRAKTPNPDATVTWHGQIADLFRSRCVECHRDGDIAPFSLTDYDSAAGWAEMILEVVTDQRMPPWHANPKYGRFVGERHLSEDEIALIRQWTDAGAPAGEPREHEPVPPRSDDWQLDDQPDATFTVQKTPYQVPATGAVKYQWFEVETGFTEDKWTRAIEIVPGNRAVVHHVLVFAVQPGEGMASRFGGGARGFLAGYVPGLRVMTAPEGMAKKIPAGSNLLFQVHYTPIGTPETDLSKIAFWFADPKTVTREIKTTSAVQPRFRIPPGAEAHTVSGIEVVSENDALLLGFMPHMHLRGSAFRYEIAPPLDKATGKIGPTEILLDIPRYDFNWQAAYQLQTPRPIAAGSKIYAHGTFDNSQRNLANPNPDTWVTWGDQTWEEMMIGYFDISVPRNDNPTAAQRAEAAARENEGRLDLAMSRLDTNGDGRITPDEAASVPQLKQYFFLIDANGDGGITREELSKVGGLLQKLRGGR